jgi:glucosyl-dolichyl phosphate glucuronosyltransferase
MILFSICICSYNRVDLLKGVIETAITQSLSVDEYEIVIVDNGSTDDTKKMVETYQKNQSNLNYFLEKELGLSNARNRAASEAQGVYLAYTDDDCRLPADWLFKAERIVKRINPDIFGGPYFPFYLDEKPKWFKEDYGSRTLGDHERYLKNGEYLSGGNFFLKKEIIKTFGGFRSDLGMKGLKIAYAEEVEFQKRIKERKIDSKLYYSPDLFVFHLVRKNKWDVKDLLSRFFSAGRYQYLALERSTVSLKLKHIAAFFILPFLILLQLTLGSLLRNRTEYTYFQNYLYERIFNLVRILGKLFQRFLCKIE